MTEVDMEVLGPRLAGNVTVAVIVERLAVAIQEGLLPEGGKLKQQDVADHFGVSRMPARIALGQLHARGLIEYRHHRSPLVVGPKPAEPPVNQARLQQLEAKLRQAKEVFDFMYRDPEAAAGCWRELAMQQADDIEAVLAVTH